MDLSFLNILLAIDINSFFRKFDGTFDSTTGKDRTSHNTWCLEECYEDEVHQNVLRNVENITGIPDTNSEYWQLLQYEESQFYAVS